MQLTQPLSRRTATAAKTNTARAAGSEHAFAEIGAYIAIRERLLAEAEQGPTEKQLDRAAIANNFVASCLKPPRSPYQAQCLPETDAARERKRCEAVKLRISRLRDKLVHAA